ncbi:MAG: hypothetical protein NZT61_02655 [Deltaproteobacteria bacterium]|nr:hypothetical protein [Deltaproteobacteria bacterium]
MIKTISVFLIALILFVAFIIAIFLDRSAIFFETRGIELSGFSLDFFPDPGFKITVEKVGNVYLGARLNLTLKGLSPLRFNLYLNWGPVTGNAVIKQIGTLRYLKGVSQAWLPISGSGSIGIAKVQADFEGILDSPQSILNIIISNLELKIENPFNVDLNGNCGGAVNFRTDFFSLHCEFSDGSKFSALLKNPTFDGKFINRMEFSKVLRILDEKFWVSRKLEMLNEVSVFYLKGNVYNPQLIIAE